MSSKSQSKREFNWKQEPILDASQPVSLLAQSSVLKMFPLWWRKNDNCFCRRLQTHSSSQGRHWFSGKYRSSDAVSPTSMTKNRCWNVFFFLLQSFEDTDKKRKALLCFNAKSINQPSMLWLVACQANCTADPLYERLIALLWKSVSLFLKLQISPWVGTESQLLLWQIHLAIVKPHERSNEKSIEWLFDVLLILPINCLIDCAVSIPAPEHYELLWHTRQPVFNYPGQLALERQWSADAKQQKQQANATPKHVHKHVYRHPHTTHTHTRQIWRVTNTLKGRTKRQPHLRRMISISAMNGMWCASSSQGQIKMLCVWEQSPCCHWVD